MIGSTVGHYRITAKLGQGGMGVVYRAEDTKLQRTVALKFLPSDTMGSEENERFLREAQAAAGIQHPNVCPIYAVEEVDGQRFIAMACLEGETLASRLARGPLPVSEAVRIALQVAKGLEQAHRHGIVHRDIKSGNIFLSEDGHASILDFGLALQADATRLTRSGASVGTPAYMSPEQIQGEPLDHRTDLWSLGAVLYEMLCGRTPFARENQMATLHAIVTQPAPQVSQCRPEAGGDLERIVACALAKPRQDRWQSASELAAALQQLLGESMAPTRTIQFPSRTQAVRRRRPSKLVSLALAGLAVLAVAGYFAWQARRQEAPRQLAILPFETSGGGEELRVLADGLADTLTAQVAGTEANQKRMQVVPATEVRAANVRSAAAARAQYGADLVVTGTARQSGGRIQLTLNLVDAPAVRQLGSKTMETEAGNAAALRSGAQEMLAGLLSLQFAREAPAAGDAQADYLRGRGFLSHYDEPGNVDRALQSFQAAMGKDPRYAMAQAGLADAYWQKAQSTGDRHWAERALESAERAVQLDGNLVMARVTLGTVYTELKRFDEARTQLNRALQLSPDNAEAMRAMGELHVSQGQRKLAEEAYREATRKRPTDWLGFLQLGIFLVQEGRLKEAEGVLQQAQGLAPDNDIVARNLGALYLRQANYELARKQLQRSLRTRPSPRTYSTLGVVFYYERRYAEAASALESAIDLDSGVYTYWGNLGTVYRWMPMAKAKAEAALRRAIELGEKQLETVPNDSNVRANLAEYWAKLGDGKRAREQIDRLTPDERKRFSTRIVLAYELMGERARAMELARAAAADAALSNSIRHDPDLRKLAEALGAV